MNQNMRKVPARCGKSQRNKSKNAIGNKVIEEVEEKWENLEIPKHCSIRPILIHVNGVEEGVLESRYFDKIIDFGDLLR